MIFIQKIINSDDVYTGGTPLSKVLYNSQDLVSMPGSVPPYLRGSRVAIIINAKRVPPPLVPLVWLIRVRYPKVFIFQVGGVYIDKHTALWWNVFRRAHWLLRHLDKEYLEKRSRGRSLYDPMPVIEDRYGNDQRA